MEKAMFSVVVDDFDSQLQKDNDDREAPSVDELGDEEELQLFGEPTAHMSTQQQQQEQQPLEDERERERVSGTDEDGVPQTGSNISIRKILDEVEHRKDEFRKLLDEHNAVIENLKKIEKLDDANLKTSPNGSSNLVSTPISI